MHRRISNHYKSGREDGKANDVGPQSAVIEAESAENGGTRDFDVEAVLMVNEG